jgi:hypothetical protein
MKNKYFIFGNILSEMTRYNYDVKILLKVVARIDYSNQVHTCFIFGRGDVSPIDR